MSRPLSSPCHLTQKGVHGGFFIFQAQDLLKMICTVSPPSYLVKLYIYMSKCSIEYPCGICRWGPENTHRFMCPVALSALSKRRCHRAWGVPKTIGVYDVYGIAAYV